MIRFLHDYLSLFIRAVGHRAVLNCEVHMQSPIDLAITAAAAAEATYNGDVQNVAQIQTAIEAATSPLAPAQAQLVTDTAAYVSALQALDQAVQAQITALAPPPAPAAA
jgi:hypothetical protein